jgi:choice-of-anchor B domain-containing protein
MKARTFYTLIILFFLISGVYAQLPNSNMTLLKNLDEHGSSSYSAIWGYTAPDGREYAILGCSNGTAFIDVTDSANIREVDFVVGLSSDWREMKTIGHYAYVVSEALNSRVQIIDLAALPDSVSLVKTTNFPDHSSTHSIQVWGTDKIILNGCNTSFRKGVTILDCADPLNPVVIAKADNQFGGNTNGYVHDCRVWKDTLYACNIYSGYITLYDGRSTSIAGDTLIPFKAFQTVPNPLPHNLAFTEDGKYIFTTDETHAPNGKLKVWDIQDKTNIVSVGTWMPTGITTAIVHNVEIYGKYALVAHYTAGIRLLDISVPSAPVELAWYDTNPAHDKPSFVGCWGVYMLPSKKIIASDKIAGFFCVKPTIPITGIINGSNVETPTAFSLKQNYPNPFNPLTKISFSITKNTFVSLKVYSLAGKEVANLVNDRRDGGNYEVNFDAGKYGLASGVYFYSLEAEGKTETKKMLLVK